jgi:hypothetical protein
VPGLAEDRFLGCHDLFLYPDGTGNAAIRPTIAPNSRLVRWFSAKSSQ